MRSRKTQEIALANAAVTGGSDLTWRAGWNLAYDTRFMLTSALLLGFVALWACSALFFNNAQWGDNLEQYVWAHGLELGYYKHPPLPTWLLLAAIELFGHSTASAVLLAAVCTTATGMVTLSIAGRLLGSSRALLAMLCWSLQQAFCVRASVFNHNTVLMLTVSITVLLVLRALESNHKLIDWAAVGIAAGAALLSKYQAIVPLAGTVLALALNHELRKAEARRGLGLSIAVATLICAPHMFWVATHSFSTLAYATQAGHTLDAGQRILSTVSFLAQQVRLVLPSLLFAALLLLGCRSRSISGALPIGPDRSRRGWMIGLIAFPLGVTTLTAPLFGLALQNHWGFQALQFASLFFANTLYRRIRCEPRAWIGVGTAVHLALLALTVSRFPTPPARALHRVDVEYPARDLAEAVGADWRRATACPLRYVVGRSFEAGLVSVYNGGSAVVLEDGDYRKSPWVNGVSLVERGAVYVANDLQALPTIGVSVTGSLDVGAASPPPNDRVFWAVVPPTRCLVSAGSK
jgi:hypothetical protein